MKEGTERRGEFKPHQDAGEPDAEVQFHIGGYSNRMQAEQDARQFMMPTVFQNRSAIFPDPRNFRLRIESLSATVRNWDKPPSPTNTLYIELVLNLWGTEADMESWCKGVHKKIDVMAPHSYGDAGERMAHLKDRGIDSPLRRGVAAPVEGVGLGGDRDKHLAETGRGAFHKEGAKVEQDVVLNQEWASRVEMTPPTLEACWALLCEMYPNESRDDRKARWADILKTAAPGKNQADFTEANWRTVLEILRSSLQETPADAHQ